MDEEALFQRKIFVFFSYLFNFSLFLVYSILATSFPSALQENLIVWFQLKFYNSSYFVYFESKK